MEIQEERDHQDPQDKEETKVSQGTLVIQETLELQDLEEIRVPLVPQVLREQQVVKVKGEIPGSLEPQEQPERLVRVAVRETLELLDQQGRVGILVQSEEQVQPEILELQVQ